MQKRKRSRGRERHEKSKKGIKRSGSIARRAVFSEAVKWRKRKVLFVEWGRGKGGEVCGGSWDCGFEGRGNSCGG